MMCSWTWMLPLTVILLAATPSCSGGVVQPNQEPPAGLTLCGSSWSFERELESLKRRVEAARVASEQLNIKRKVEEYNSTKDWTALRRSLEEGLDHESAAYKQLKYIKYEETWVMWNIGINGYMELATVLVVSGRGADTQDKDGGTMLQGAARNGHTDMVEMLLDHGANMELKGGEFRKTAIIYAAQEYRLDVVKLLAQRGANLDQGDSDGATSLHWAAWGGRLDMVQYLVEAEANTTATNKEGNTPLETCAQRGRTAVVQYLSRFPH